MGGASQVPGARHPGVCFFAVALARRRGFGAHLGPGAVGASDRPASSSDRPTLLSSASGALSLVALLSAPTARPCRLAGFWVSRWDPEPLFAKFGVTHVGAAKPREQAIVMGIRQALQLW